MRKSSSVFIAACAMLAGCVSSHVMVGTPRPPISPDLVRVYLHPPESRYEEIAMLDTSSRGSFAITAQGKTNKVIERLKEEAAKMGANGLLLQGVGDQAAGSVGFGSATASGHSAYGIGIGGAVYIKSGSGVAIYVPPVE